MHWNTVEGKLVKTFSFVDFAAALAFVNNVGEIAEELNHHPDIRLHSYNNVNVVLYTHSENAITSKDQTLAKRIDELNA